MSEKFHYYRSELKSKNISKYKFIGISSEIILSNTLFPKNENLIPFLKSVFEISYKDYVIKSRTMILARTIRYIYDVENNKLEQFRKGLLDFVSNEALETNDNDKRKKNSSFEKWMDGIQNADN